MKTVVIVAPHYLPCYLPSVHRSRLWTYYLKEFGWKPVILTTDPAYYESPVAEELMDLAADDVQVIRTKALPTKPLRLVGDIGYRSMWWYRKALLQMAAQRGYDFLHFTVPAFTPALLGPGLYARTGIPYGIDYIDPWIKETPSGHRFPSKHWFAEMLGRISEPYAVKRARLITGINRAYFESVLNRHPHLREDAVSVGMPYGGSERDYEALQRRPREPFLFRERDMINVVYAGALVPKAFGVLDRLLQAVRQLKEGRPDLSARLRIHFVGTGLYDHDATRGHTVTPFIEKQGVEDIVSEMPSRISYMDSLNHLRASAGILVIGSTEKHYSPSKIYQSVMSRRPVLALLHEESTAAPTLRASNAGRVICFNESELPDPAHVAAEMIRFVEECANYDANRVNWEAFKSVSARETTRLLAEGMDQALELEKEIKARAPR
jgi:hypothetical protein